MTDKQNFEKDINVPCKELNKLETKLLVLKTEREVHRKRLGGLNNNDR